MGHYRIAVGCPLPWQICVVDAVIGRRVEKVGISAGKAPKARRGEYNGPVTYNSGDESVPVMMREVAGVAADGSCTSWPVMGNSLFADCHHGIRRRTTTVRTNDLGHWRPALLSPQHICLSRTWVSMPKWSCRGERTKA